MFVIYLALFYSCPPYGSMDFFSLEFMANCKYKATDKKLSSDILILGFLFKIFWRLNEKNLSTTDLHDKKYM